MSLQLVTIPLQMLLYEEKTCYNSESSVKDNVSQYIYIPYFTSQLYPWTSENKQHFCGKMTWQELSRQEIVYQSFQISIICLFDRWTCIVKLILLW